MSLHFSPFENKLDNRSVDYEKKQKMNKLYLLKTNNSTNKFWVYCPSKEEKDSMNLAIGNDIPRLQSFHVTSSLTQVTAVAKCQWHLIVIPGLIRSELAASLHQLLTDRCSRHENHIQNVMPISLRHSTFPSYQPNNSVYFN